MPCATRDLGSFLYHAIDIARSRRNEVVASRCGVASGKAAEIAGLTQAAFLKELGRRRVPIHYGMDELAEDLKVVESFHNR